MKKLLPVLLGLSMALGGLTLSLAGEQDPGTTENGQARKARKGGKGKGKRGKKGKGGKRNRNGGGQTPGTQPK